MSFVIFLVRTSDFDFVLPEELIAQHPTAQRDHSRLLVLARKTNSIAHARFFDLEKILRPDDLLVLNNSRVIAARLRAFNPRTHGEFEILLVEENAVNDWWAMMRPGKRARLGTELLLKKFDGSPSGITVTVREINSEGHRRLSFTGIENISTALPQLGEIPLPPYIHRNTLESDDRSRYQTVYAQDSGSVAAPTAGLHFTEALLARLKASGIESCYVTLHVGLGTFAPVKTEELSQHKMHKEKFIVPAQTAAAINHAKAEKRRVVAVGTTTVRVLESVAQANGGKLVAGEGRTSIFISPPFRFQVVDALLTNFHLPRSTLLMLVSAFAAPGECTGRERILAAYHEAIRERYRFFSYGDAMLLL